MKTVVDRCRRTIDPRAVLPAAADLEHVDDAADNPPIVVAMRPGLVLWQQRLDHRPLPIVEPEFPRHDPSLRSFQLESRRSLYVNRLIGF